MFLVPKYKTIGVKIIAAYNHWTEALRENINLINIMFQ